MLSTDKATRLISGRARCVALLAATFWLAHASLVTAAGLQVSPITLNIAAERGANGLTLRNTGNKSIHAQVRVFEWRQQDGKDELQPTRALVASPPQLELPAGGQQLVRIVRLAAAPTATEASYRLIVDELPERTSLAVPISREHPGATPPGTSAIQLLLKYSVPVFLLPPKQVALQPILNTRLVKTEDGRAIEIQNSGNSHAQIADLALVQGEQRASIAPGLSGYLLPGKQRQWHLPDTLAHSGELTVVARVNGEIDERILAHVSVDR